MIHLIVGGSGSGKSGFAEDWLCGRYPDDKKIYLATMQAYGEEGKKRVKRHRLLRNGKGFETLGQSRSVGALTEKIEGRAVLLECMSNLVANEMFVEITEEAKETGVSESAEEAGITPQFITLSEGEVTEKILKDIHSLAMVAEPLVIVSNNVFEDGVEYDTDTRAYLEALGTVNSRLAAMADVVTEVVAGIPVVMKGNL